ncbi:MAG: hypothetical protein K6U04_09500, partial [Armatimonadetes bacterium]|nr:hypothetical protein [Armatimonadota bacterium]
TSMRVLVKFSAWMSKFLFGSGYAGLGIKSLNALIAFAPRKKYITAGPEKQPLPDDQKVII